MTVLGGLTSLVSQALVPAVSAVRAVCCGESRKTWCSQGRVQIEVRGVHLPGTESAGGQVVRSLEELPGVHWAAINAALGRVVVDHDPALINSAELVEVVEQAEEAAGLAKRPRAEDEATYPGRPTGLLGHAVVMGANLAGLGYAITASALRAPALPVSVPAMVSLADVARPVRGAVESVVGRAAADGWFGLAGAAANTAAQRSTSLLVDAAARWCLVREVGAVEHGWQRWEAEVGTRAEHHRSEPLKVGSRRAALPDGPIERVTRTSLIAGPVVGATSLGLTGSLQRAQAFLVASVPRAAGVGREAFAAQLGSALGRREALVIDPKALRRLDRIDAVVIDAVLLHTGVRSVSEVTPLNGEVDVGGLWEQAHALVDVEPQAYGSHDGWALSDPDHFAVSLRETRDQHRGSAAVRVLTRDARPVAWVEVEPERDPLTEELLRAARRVGCVMLVGSDRRLAERFGVGHADSTDLLTTVRALQAQGRGVAVVSASGLEGLAAADLGIGVTRGGRPPWGADVVIDAGLGQACEMLRWIPAARTVSRRSAQLAMLASATAAALAGLGPAAGSQVRAAVPISTCALIALGVGVWSGMRAAIQPVPVAAARIPWHTMSPAQVLHRVGSTPQGLTDQDAQSRVADHTDNGDVAGMGLMQAFLDELASPLTPALAAGAGISASIGALSDAVIIAGVLASNALIGAVQRFSADRAVATLRRAHAVAVTVRRSNTTLQGRAEQLVVGDVIELVAGDAVAADCRLLEADELEVDESSLTGESQLVTKTVTATPGVEVADRRCMVYQGTAIAAGRALAVVVATGAATEATRAHDSDDAPQRPTGVQARLQTLVKVAVPISVGAGVLVLATDLIRRQPMSTALGRGVSVAVAAVPEGLPFVSTVAELAAARRLSRHGALVHNASTIETLGRADVLCFDKTGTLTEGRMALRAVCDGAITHTLQELSTQDKAVLAAALRASPAFGDADQLPHPTDRAVVTGARVAGVRPSDDAADWQVIDELPFEPSRGFHAVLGRVDDHHMLSVKGAPEVVLEACTHWRRNGDVEPLDEASRLGVDKEFDRLARQGYRVLAIAERPAGSRRDLEPSRVRDLHLVGLLALADPPRPTAANAVDRLQRAGVRIMMITGDHPSTAEAIAAELGILNGHQVLTGGDLDDLDDDELATSIGDVAVFARATPAHKARIVRALQRGDCIVAVTGDGANDAPAIRIADIGIALGESATPAAREAADVVITDERIETIVEAIVEGRGMWSSVRDALALLLGGNLGEIGFTVATGLLSRGGAMNTRQMLLVNLLTDVLPAMAIAVRPPPQITPERLLTEGPDASLGAALIRDIVQRGIITGASAFSAWTLVRATGTRRHTDTAALVALVGAQLGQTLAIRGRTLLVVVGSLASMAILATIVQTPGLSHFFGCTPLLPHGWIIAGGCSAAATIAAVLLQARTQRAIRGPAATTDHGDLDRNRQTVSYVESRHHDTSIVISGPDYVHIRTITTHPTHDPATSGSAPDAAQPVSVT